MIRKLFSIFAGSLVIAGAAQAADLTSPEPVPEAAAMSAALYNWTGFYAGLGGGYGWASNDRENSFGFQNSYDGDGAFIGAQAGYRHQWNRFVLGAELDANWANVTGDDGGAGGTTDETEFNWLTAATIQAGYAWDKLYLYALGGGTLAGVKQSNDAAPGWSKDTTLAGWTVGAGVAYAFTEKLSADLQYRYTDFGSKSYDPSNGIIPFSVDSNVQQVRLEINYKF